MVRLGYDLSSSTSVELKEAQLEMAGIDKEAQAYWKMVVPPGLRRALDLLHIAALSISIPYPCYHYGR